MLSTEEFIVTVFCYADDYFNNLSDGHKLRSRGSAPALCDSGVITTETVGGFPGSDTDGGIREYFLCHRRHLFPAVGCRTASARRAAGLRFRKIPLRRKSAQECGASDDGIHIADGFPVPVRHFGRAFFSGTFRGGAAYGHCAAKNGKYCGFGGHILISLTGVITACTPTAADGDGRDALPELPPGIRGPVTGDKGCISKAMRGELLSRGINLRTPFRTDMKDDRDPCFVRTCVPVRGPAGTVIGQLCGHFSIQKVRARDLRHPACGTTRKILSRTAAVFINRLHGREPLQFGIIG